MKTGGVEDHESDRELEKRNQDLEAALAEANHELEAYSHTISHDLRAPLRRIGGFARLLEAEAAAGLDDDSRMALDAILHSVKEMGDLINDLLAFSRVGRVELKREEVDLEVLVEEVLHSMSEVLAGRRIEWHRQRLPRVWGDPDLLRQVFASLLDNAVKYSRPRDPAHIGLSWKAGDDDTVVIAVRDDGVGFDMAHAAKLFGIFQRLHRADEFEGNGIGLATVQKILRRHDGKIRVEAKPGEGATFFLTLHTPSANPS